jgi:hypothetical protein
MRIAADSIENYIRWNQPPEVTFDGSIGWRTSESEERALRKRTIHSSLPDRDGQKPT